MKIPGLFARSWRCWNAGLRPQTLMPTNAMKDSSLKWVITLFALVAIAVFSTPISAAADESDPLTKLIEGEWIKNGGDVSDVVTIKSDGTFSVTGSGGRWKWINKAA